MRPFVSIVVPVFNGARFLRETLDSLVRQTWSAREILVLDDASTDETPAIIASYGDALRSVRQPTNRGQFGNVADGIARATGELVAVYHADDVYDSTIVEREAQFLADHPEVGVVFCLDRFLDGDGREYGRLALPAELREENILDFARVFNAILEHKNVFLPTPGAMARRALYERVGPYRPEFGSAADLDMWLRMAREQPVGIIAEHLFGYRHTVTSVGQSYQNVRLVPENFFEVVDRHWADGAAGVATSGAERAYRAHRAVDYLRIAGNAYIRGELALTRQFLAHLRLAHLLGSPRIPRRRMVLLYTGLAALCRLPHLPLLGRALHRQWYDRLPWRRAV